tara:strand:- start:2860 stop:3297 length:438 start_codon:yes stop_codon:yes gene_type:complete
MARQTTCKVDSFVFGSEDVQNYQMDKCVTDSLSLMGGDTKQCVRHIVAMTHDHPQLKGCTNRDVEAVCQLSKSSFTVQDAEKLCQRKLSAERSFWEEKRSSTAARSPPAAASACEGGRTAGEVTSAHATAAGKWRLKNPSYYETI